MNESTERTPFERGRIAFMEGKSLHLGKDTDLDFAAGWLDALEEIVTPWRTRRTANG